MKNITIYAFILSAALLLGGVAHAAERSLTAAQGVIERTLGYQPKDIKLALIDRDAAGNDVYTLEVRRGVLRIAGTDAVSICKGFHDYMLSHGYGVTTSSGSRFELPERYPEMPLQRVVSPFKNRIYMNVCTFGYTTPYWKWTQWQAEIDRMALLGYNMPLAPIAGEAIFARVWRDMGLSDAEINELWTGPGHMPWMRMGNMSGLDGAPTPAWHKAQIELQHQIIDRMQSLDMNPVFQGFAGFVPPAMKKHYPKIHLTETKWCGFKNWMLSVQDSLFSQIGSRYITAWEKEFGKGKYYLVDSFNEMDIPFGKQGSPERAATLQQYSQTLYHSISRANPDAVWVMQGWMFGYQRNVWDPESVKALLSGAPQGKLIVVDLAVDFNKHIWRNPTSWDYLSGFFGTDWIFSTVPNFGGRTALTGDLEFYANGHLEALSSPNRGRLVGLGTSPEGVENNDIVYEVISAAGWSDSKIDIQEFLHNYSVSRYGKASDQIDTFWREMLQSCYKVCSNNARFCWQLRPFNHRMSSMNINDHYYTAIESFLSASGEFAQTETYRTDAIQYAALYLAAKADVLFFAAHWAYTVGEQQQAAGYIARMEELLLQADRLLESHPILRLARWSEMAREAGCTPEERERFVLESRRLVSVWGGPSLGDYSARVWSGLIRDYYVPRLRHYFQAKTAGKSIRMAEWNKKWYADAPVSQVAPYADPVAAAKQAVAAARDITDRMMARPTPTTVDFWSPSDFSVAAIRQTFTIDHKDFEQLKGLRFTSIRGTSPVTVEAVICNSNNVMRATSKVNQVARPGGAPIYVPLNKETVTEPLSKEVSIAVLLRGAKEIDNYGIIELVFE